jgi:hypothetical protein
MTVASRERSGPLALGDAASARVLLALVGTAGGVLVFVLRTRLTFFNDDWYFLLQRPGLESHGGLDTLLAPHNGNIVVLLAALAGDPYLTGVTAGRYFKETGARGSPPFYSPEQIAIASSSQRRAADRVLATADGVSVRPAATRRSDNGCPRLAAGIAKAGPSLALSPGGAVVRNLAGVGLVIGVAAVCPIMPR